MNTERAPRTPDPENCEGMERIDHRRERMTPSRGFGGNPLTSAAWQASGEDGEDGEDICNPPRAYVPLRGLGSVDALSCVGPDLSSPSPPSSPFATQPIVFIRLHPLHFQQSILSLFQSIPSIPSKEINERQYHV